MVYHISFLTMDPLSSDPFSTFLSSHAFDHITSSPLYPRSNSFIEQQIKTIKTSLTTTQSSNISIDHLLWTSCSTLIGPNFPSPHEILLNCIKYRPGQPSTPINLEQVRDYLITNKKAIGLMAQLKEEPSNVETKSSKTIHGHQLCMMYTCVL